MKDKTDCDKYVYLDGKFAVRTDEDGVAFLRSECIRVGGSDDGLEVRKEYHNKKMMVLGCTGGWLRQSEGVVSLKEEKS